VDEIDGIAADRIRQKTRRAIRARRGDIDRDYDFCAAVRAGRQNLVPDVREAGGARYRDPVADDDGEPEARWYALSDSP